MKNEITESKMLQVLDWAYEKSTHGIMGLDSAQELAESYIQDNGSLEDKINSLIRWQNTKCATSGFLSGLGGIMTLPVAIPANVSSVLFVQIRMIAAIAHMCGRDLRDDKVKTLVYTCLCGSAIKDILKNAGIQVTNKLTTSMIQKYLTREVIKKINQAVGFRLITKAGEKGVINAMKIVPVVGGIVGATFDATTTNLIGNAARNLFLYQEL
ncbi:MULTISPECIES: EcsC family protein [unclassified Pasteurella]|uniref:EcsC family protein n=1 Tax=unclassified Pasteurella TaxID=2621516 RepID=UPI001073BF8B|nr:EcsC family protein [Pasteurella sp. 19428wF3_WM03]TFU50432.1 EcsC family protein [Pasteurella sp. WM03]